MKQTQQTLELEKRKIVKRRFTELLIALVASTTLLVAFPGSRAQVAPLQRGFGVASLPAATEKNGSYYALVIGINQYKHLQKLLTAVNDAKSVSEVLRDQYGFQVQTLQDDEATRSNILDTLSGFRTLRENDNLLVYYAGHGMIDRETGTAYWMPVDAEPDRPSHSVSVDDIKTSARGIPARHILLISDSCYSGVMTRDVSFTQRTGNPEKFLQRMLDGKSRSVMASGSDEPVADSGKEGHSVFANAVLDGLKAMGTGPFTARELFDQHIQRAVAGGSQQLPQYSLIPNSGDNGGDFVFFPKPQVLPPLHEKWALVVGISRFEDPKYQASALQSRMPGISHLPYWIPRLVIFERTTFRFFPTMTPIWSGSEVH